MTITIACGSDSEPIAEPLTPSVHAVRVSPESVALLALGATLQLSAVALDEEGVEIPGIDFTWTSSDLAVAEVDTAGLVVASGIGWATITATANAVGGDAEVWVDPDMVLQNYCDDCHAGHATVFATLTCPDCHSMSTAPSDADHRSVTNGHDLAADGFVLSGAHLTIGCQYCHYVDTGEPRFGSVEDTDCYTCHGSDYRSQHDGTGYPIACLTCHTPESWAGASFDHDAQYFPIYSGAHRNKWETCATCHVLPTDFSDFTCFTCHIHNRESMEERHEGVSEYAYESQACYGCHPDGEE